MSLTKFFASIVHLEITQAPFADSLISPKKQRSARTDAKVAMLINCSSSTFVFLIVLHGSENSVNKANSV